MRVLDQSEIRIDWADIGNRTFHKRKIDKRSSGLHLSAIVKQVAIATGQLKESDFEDETMPLRMVVGLAWEEFAVTLYEDLIWQPGEQSSDGIFGSPDGLSEIDGHHCLEEFKATWMSSHTRTDITRELKWMWQLMGYCKMLGLLRARLHVLWVNGNYRGSGPRYMRYTIAFTRKEIDLFWENVILANREGALEEKH